MSILEFNNAQTTRAGYEYQDLVAIELLLQLYKNPDHYDWAQLDSDNKKFKSIDDIVLKHQNANSYDAYQVKFTVDPKRFFVSVKWLTDKLKPKKNSKNPPTSLIQKWSSRVLKLQEGGASVSASLITNRPFSGDIKEYITEENKLNFLKLPEEQQSLLANEIGGTDKAITFFSEFIFNIHPHIQVNLNSLEDKRREVRNSLVPQYTDDHGWRILQDKVKSWSIHKNDPLPDGKVTHSHLKSIIRLGRPAHLIQNFLVPENYAQPNEGFFKIWSNQVVQGNSTNVLWGLPGQGKSTFLSAYIHKLREKKILVARHHYFLSLAENNSDRFAYDAIENSIIEQIEVFLPVKKRPVDTNNRNKLKASIKAASDYAVSKSTIFVLIIDGLDHVWREGGSNDQMNHLFMNIVFDYDGYSLICGTQKIEEKLLPPSLLKQCPVKNWVPMPPLSFDNVSKLIEPKLKNGEIQFENHYKYEQVDYLRLLHDLCSGNPLVLTYILEELSQPHKQWTYSELSAINPSPSSGVEGYYNNLWNRLSHSGRQALMLMSCAEFNWPSVGSISSVVNQNLSENVGYAIDHLVSQKRTQVIPFHSSLLVWIRRLDEYKAEEDKLFGWAQNWMNSDAPEFLKWRWVDILNSKKGGDGFKFGTTRKWVLFSLNRGYDIDDIIGVLDQGYKFAFMNSDFSEAIRYRSMRTRLSNADYNFHELDIFQAQRKCKQFTNQDDWNRFMDNLQFIQEDSVLLKMVLHAHGHGMEVDLELLADELRNRQNEALEIGIDDWHSFCSAVEPILFADTIQRPRDNDKLIEFLSRKGDTSSFFKVAASAMIKDNDYEAVKCISAAMAKKKKIHPQIIAQKLITAATLDADRLPPIPYLEQQPFWVLANAVQGHELEFSEDIIPNPKFSKSDYAGMVDRDKSISFFEQVIWVSLAGGFQNIRNIAEQIIPLISEEEDVEWLKETIESVVYVGFELGKEIATKKRPFKFDDLYSRLNHVTPVQWANTRDKSYTHYVSFRMALMKCSVLFVQLNRLLNPLAVFVLAELETATKSEHWLDELFVEKYVNFRVKAFDVDAAKLIIYRVVNTLNSYVTQFDERASLLTHLIIFSDMHDLRDIQEVLISRANNCLIGYGYRKDFWIWEVVQAVEFLHAHGNVDVQSYIQRLAPCVDAVGDYTDGDETPGVTTEFSRLIRKAWPERLSNRYKAYIREDEWHEADKIFTDLLEDVDGKNPFAAALAKTGIDTKGALALSKNADYESKNMDEVRDVIQRYSYPLYEKEDTSNSANDDEQSFVFNPEDYIPEKLKDVVELINDHTMYEHSEEIFETWLGYWEGKGRAVEILELSQKILSVYKRHQLRFNVLTDLFKLSLKWQSKKEAFEWAVMAHRINSIWSPMWVVQDSKAYPFLDIVAENFKHRALEYIHQVSHQKDEILSDHFPGPSIGTDRLVYFLTKCGQLDLAIEYTEEMLSILEDELSEQPLPDQRWLQ